MNEDGTGLETLNHVGRHELARYFDSSHDGLPEFIAPQNRRTADLVLQLREDPLRPGYFYATTAPEFGTHAAGRIIGLDAPEDLNADDIEVDYITSPLSDDIVGDGQTPPAGHPGHFRNPLPLSDGTLVAVHTTSPYADRAQSTACCRRATTSTSCGCVSGTPDWIARRAPAFRTASASRSRTGTTQSYAQLSYSGPLWELDPVEVRARPRPPRHSNPLPAIETTLLRDELGGDAAIERLRAFLVGAQPGADRQPQRHPARRPAAGLQPQDRRQHDADRRSGRDADRDRLPAALPGRPDPRLLAVPRGPAAARAAPARRSAAAARRRAAGQRAAGGRRQRRRVGAGRPRADLAARPAPTARRWCASATG